MISALRNKGAALALVAGLLGVSSLGAGCQDNAYCFDCDGGYSSNSSMNTGTGQGGAGGGQGGNGGDFNPVSSASGSGTGGQGGCDPNCVVTNGGNEICDQKDNDCDCVVDDIDGLDLSAEDLAAVLAVDPEEWKAELPQITEWFEKFGDKLPSTMWDELEILKSRLA